MYNPFDLPVNVCKKCWISDNQCRPEHLVNFDSDAVFPVVHIVYLTPYNT